MATLAAHDPGHGAHPWSWMKTRLFLGCSERCIAVTRQESGHAPLRESKVGQRSRQGSFHGGAEKHRNCTLAQEVLLKSIMARLEASKRK